MLVEGAERLRWVGPGAHPAKACGATRAWGTAPRIAERKLHFISRDRSASGSLEPGPLTGHQRGGYPPKMSAHVSEEVVRVAETFATVARALAKHRDDVQAGLEKIGPSDWFTSAVRIDTIVERDERSTLNVAPVHFTRGGTHCWHPHDGGQTLYVTEGDDAFGLGASRFP